MQVSLTPTPVSPSSVSPSAVRHTFGFPFCQRLWALTKHRDNIVVADMEVHIVADMEVDKVAHMASDKKKMSDMEMDLEADMEVDKVADKVADMVADSEEKNRHRY